MGESLTNRLVDKLFSQSCYISLFHIKKGTKCKMYNLSIICLITYGDEACHGNEPSRSAEI